jgi:hypothetical protein
VAGDVAHSDDGAKSDTAAAAGEGGTPG